MLKTVYLYIFIVFISIFSILCLDSTANSNKTPEYSLSKNNKEKEWKQFLKNIDLSHSRESNGLKMFIKPMSIGVENKIYINEIPSKEKDEIKHTQYILMGIKNTSGVVPFRTKLLSGFVACIEAMCPPFLSIISYPGLALVKSPVFI